MKAAIKDILQKKGKLEEIKLQKLVAKCMVDEYGEGKEKEFKNRFDTDLFSLVSKRKVVDDKGVYSLFEKQNGTEIVNTELGLKKRKLEETAEAVNGDEKEVKTLKASVGVVDLWKNGERLWKEGGFDSDYLQKNPDRITRLFCGNLNKKVTEEELKKCISGITHIKWITDKESGEFYGSSFLELKDPESAAVAVLQDKSKFMGRPLKIFYCPPKPGDVWPPTSSQSKGGKAAREGDGGTNNPPRRERSEKPHGCRKLFAGNLSYNIDDETMVDFFKDCGKLIGLRWLTHKDSGEFKGCGYVEFRTTEEADAAIKLDGKELLGRNIRLDWG
eukprot:gene26716-35395_t